MGMKENFFQTTAFSEEGYFYVCNEKLEYLVYEMSNIFSTHGK